MKLFMNDERENFKINSYETRKWWFLNGKYYLWKGDNEDNYIVD